MSDYISRQEAIDRFSEALSSEAEFEKAKQVIIEAPTLDEKEIIRKAFERVIKKLKKVEKELTDNSDSVACTMGILNATIRARKIIEEECGINE